MGVLRNDSAAAIATTGLPLTVIEPISIVESYMGGLNCQNPSLNQVTVAFNRAVTTGPSGWTFYKNKTNPNPELVTDSDFTAGDLSNWVVTAQFGGTTTWNNNAVDLVANGGLSGVKQDIGLQSDTLYDVTVVVTDITGTLDVLFADVISAEISTPGTHTFTLSASGILLGTVGVQTPFASGTATVDSIGCKLSAGVIETRPATQVTGSGSNKTFSHDGWDTEIFDTDSFELEYTGGDLKDENAVPAGDLTDAIVNCFPNINATVTDTPIVTTPGDYPGVDGDINYTETKTGGTVTNYKINAPGASFESLNGNAAVDSAGNVTWLADGDSVVRVYRSGYQSEIINKPISNTNGPSTFVTDSFRNGTLGLQAQTEIEALISGSSTGDTNQQYITSSNENFSSPAVTFNAQLFCDKGLFDGVSVINENSTGQPKYRYPLAAVSSRHAVGALHVDFLDATQYVFTDGTNYHTAVIDSTQDISAGDDIELICFTQDLPAWVTRYKVPPADWIETYAPSGLDIATTMTGKTSTAIPILVTDAHDLIGGDESYIQILRVYGQWGPTNDGRVRTNGEALAPLTDWGVSTISGDSSSAMMTLVNGEPVLLGMVKTDNEMGNLSAYISEINTAMDTLAGAPAGTYQLQIADWTEFAGPW